MVSFWSCDLKKKFCVQLEESFFFKSAYSWVNKYLEDVWTRL